MAIGSTSASGGARDGLRATSPSSTRIPSPPEPISSSLSRQDHPFGERRRAAWPASSSRPVGHHRARAARRQPSGPRRRSARRRRCVAGSSPGRPRSTVHTFSRSASGCCSAVSTRPTTKFSAPGRRGEWIASTFVPVIVRRSSIAAHIQRRDRSIRAATAAGPASELLQEAQVVLVVQPQVGDAVLEHRDPLDAETPREPLDPLGVIAGRVRLGRGHVRVDVRVDLAGAEHLEPALALAQVAAGAVLQEAPAVAVEAGHVDLDAGLGEREEVRAQPARRARRRRPPARTPAACPSGPPA